MTSTTKSNSSNSSPEDLGVVSEETEADTTTSRTETRETTSSSQRGSSSTEEPPEEEEATPAEGASTTLKEATEVDSTKQVPGEASREAEEVPEGEAVLDIITERKRITKVTADPASSPSTPLERATEADAAVTPWREAAEACP
jgi:hypothetical protein